MIDQERSFIEEAEATVIHDRQGYARIGYICKHSAGCPYAVDDCEGIPACYQDMFFWCRLKSDE